MQILMQQMINVIRIYTGILEILTIGETININLNVTTDTTTAGIITNIATVCLIHLTPHLETILLVKIQLLF